jgi:hypothetical protein
MITVGILFFLCLDPFRGDLSFVLAYLQSQTHLYNRKTRQMCYSWVLVASNGVKIP